MDLPPPYNLDDEKWRERKLMGCYVAG